MSYSRTVKEELGGHVSPARHCQIAEFAALFALCGRVRRQDDGTISLEIRTENLTVAEKFDILLRMAFQTKAEIQGRNAENLSPSQVYFIQVTDSDTVLTILKAVKLLDETENRWGDFSGVPYRLVQNTCCKRAYLRGVFIATGSVTNPEKAYHLEIAVLSEQYCRQLCELVASFGIDAKIVERKKYYVLYVKEGSQIVDFLNVMEAPISLMNFENVRIVKELRNSVNRQVNCETANIHKTVTAAMKQIEDIRYIEQHKGFSQLTDALREVAELRLDYPESSLLELGQMLSKPIGKSGVNHRLRKLSEIAEKMRERQWDNPTQRRTKSHDYKED